MSLITAIKYFPARSAGSEQVLLMAGYGGKIWQLRPLIRILNRAGYNVTAVDFSKSVFQAGDPSLMHQLADECLALADETLNKRDQPVLLIGVSLGALMGVNILRRDKRFKRAVLITGGDIVKVAHRLYGSKVWPQSYEELAHEWSAVNMYTEPAMNNVSVLLVLPSGDKLIDPEDVRVEGAKQAAAGNHFLLLERRGRNHIGAIIEETVLFPRRVLGYIQQIDQVPKP